MNKQITEDYVSFEIAKLLKEKGFDGECRMTYREHDMKIIYHTPSPNDLLDFTTNRKKLETLSKKNHCEYCLCPTHQMALKWLMEIYHCHVIIEYTFKADAKLTNDYVSYCYSVENANTFIAFTQDEWYDTYKEAVEAALLDVLKNLI